MEKMERKYISVFSKRAQVQTKNEKTKLKKPICSQVANSLQCMKTPGFELQSKRKWKEICFQLLFVFYFSLNLCFSSMKDLQEKKRHGLHMQNDKVSDNHVYAYLRYLEAAGREHELRQLRCPEKQRTKLPSPTYWSSSCSFSPALSQLIRTIQAIWYIMS